MLSSPIKSRGKCTHLSEAANSSNAKECWFELRFTASFRQGNNRAACRFIQIISSFPEAFALNPLPKPNCGFTELLLPTQIPGGSIHLPFFDP
jgi:hypothetical protein